MCIQNLGDLIPSEFKVHSGISYVESRSSYFAPISGTHAQKYQDWVELVYHGFIQNSRLGKYPYKCSEHSVIRYI